MGSLNRCKGSYNIMNSLPRGDNAQTPTSSVIKLPKKLRRLSTGTKRKSTRKSSPQIIVGEEVSVVVSGEKIFGRIRYVGQVEFSAGTWCGIDLYEALGQHDGSFKGIRYFSCREKHGILKPVQKVYRVTEDTARSNNSKATVSRSKSALEAENEPDNMRIAVRSVRSLPRDSSYTLSSQDSIQTRPSLRGDVSTEGIRSRSNNNASPGAVSWRSQFGSTVKARSFGKINKLRDKFESRSSSPATETTKSSIPKFKSRPLSLQSDVDSGNESMTVSPSHISTIVPNGVESPGPSTKTSRTIVSSFTTPKPERPLMIRKYSQDQEEDYTFPDTTESIADHSPILNERSNSDDSPEDSAAPLDVNSLDVSTLDKLLDKTFEIDRETDAPDLAEVSLPEQSESVSTPTEQINGICPHDDEDASSSPSNEQADVLSTSHSRIPLRDTSVPVSDMSVNSFKESSTPHKRRISLTKRATTAISAIPIRSLLRKASKPEEDELPSLKTQKDSYAYTSKEYVPASERQADCSDSLTSSSLQSNSGSKNSSPLSTPGQSRYGEENINVLSSSIIHEQQFEETSSIELREETITETSPSVEGDGTTPGMGNFNCNMAPNKRYSLPCDAELEAKEFFGKKLTQTDMDGFILVDKEPATKDLPDGEKLIHNDFDFKDHKKTEYPDANGNNSMTQKFLELEEVCSNLRNELNGRNARIVELESACEKLKNEANIKNGTILELEENIGNTKLDLSKKMDSISQLEDSISLLREELKTAENSGKESRYLVETLRDEANQKDEVLVKFEQERDVVKQKLFAAQSRWKDKQLVLEGVLQVLKYHLEKLSCLEQRCCLLKSSHASMRQDLHSCQEELEHGKLNIDSLQDKLQSQQEQHGVELNAAKKEKEEELAKLTSSLSVEKHEALDKLSNDFHAKIEILKNDHNSVISSLTADHELSANDLKSAHQQELDKLKQENKEFIQEKESEHSSLVERIEEEHQDQINDMQEKISTMESERQSLQKELESDCKVQAAVAQYKHLPEEIRSLQAVMEIKNEKIKQLEIANMQLEKRVEDHFQLQEKFDALRLEKENLRAALESKKLVERQVSVDRDAIAERLERESRKVQRLSMEKEQLMWRASNPDISFNSSGELNDSLLLDDSPPSPLRRSSGSLGVRRPRSSRNNFNRRSLNFPVNEEDSFS